LSRDEFELDTLWHELIVSVTIGAAWMFSLVGGWLTGMLGLQQCTSETFKAYWLREAPTGLTFDNFIFCPH
jgi:hypothetical protein